MLASDLPIYAANLSEFSRKMSYSSENNSSPEILVDCIQLIVGTFSNVSLDSFLNIEQEYIYIYIYIYMFSVFFVTYNTTLLFAFDVHFTPYILVDSVMHMMALSF